MYVGQQEAELSAPKQGVGPAIQSSYLDFLPALYRDTDFMGQFLMIFESIMRPIEGTVGNIPLYFDPGLTPQGFLLWLGSWVGLVLDENLPVTRRRELVKSAAELYRWRGTKKGLTEYLRICTGVVPQISEHIAGMRLGPDTKLGIDTQLGSSGAGHHFMVTMRPHGDNPLNDAVVKAIIDSQKPAHTFYTLRIEPTP